MGADHRRQRQSGSGLRRSTGEASTALSTDAAVCADARRLLRAALDRCLDGRELRSRQVMLALRKGK